MPHRRRHFTIRRERDLYVAGLTRVRIASKFKLIKHSSSRVNITGSKKKAIMIFTTRPTAEPSIRLDILGHRFDSKKDKNYCIIRMRSGRLVAISLNIGDIL